MVSCCLCGNDKVWRTGLCCSCYNKERRKLPEVKEKQKLYRMLPTTKQRLKKYRELHKEVMQQQDKKRYIEKREFILAQCKEYYLRNREIRTAHARNYYSNNKQKWLDYKLKNKDKIKLWAKAYFKNYFYNRTKSDERFNTTHKLRARIYNAFKYYSKTGKILKAREYGIDYAQIISYLGPMPLDGQKYHIDHIIPLSYFDLSDSEQIKIAFAPSNHQWLPAIENIKKNNKLDWRGLK